jgi:hypothetical protein
MTITDLKKIEKLASESARYAQKSLRKSDELELYLSMLEYKTGNVKMYRSAKDLIRTAKRA